MQPTEAATRTKLASTMCVQEGEDRAVYMVRCWAITTLVFGFLAILIFIGSIIQNNISWISILTLVLGIVHIASGGILSCCTGPVTKKKTTVAMVLQSIAIALCITCAAGTIATFAWINSLIDAGVDRVGANNQGAQVVVSQVRSWFTIYIIVFTVAYFLIGIFNGAQRAPPAPSPLLPESFSTLFPLRVPPRALRAKAPPSRFAALC